MYAKNYHLNGADEMIHLKKYFHLLATQWCCWIEMRKQMHTFNFLLNLMYSQYLMFFPYVFVPTK